MPAAAAWPWRCLFHQANPPGWNVAHQGDRRHEAITQQQLHGVTWNPHHVDYHWVGRLDGTRRRCQTNWVQLAQVFASKETLFRDHHTTTKKKGFWCTWSMYRMSTRSYRAPQNMKNDIWKSPTCQMQFLGQRSACIYTCDFHIIYIHVQSCLNSSGINWTCHVSCTHNYTIGCM